MYRQTSKRRQLIARVLVYTLMTISVLVIVVVLMMVILGYSFNRKDGRIEQGGLLQFASVPSGALVTLDDIQMGSRTPSKASVEAKSHSVRMDLTGYRTWQKSILVHAGGIGWLSYARLIPSDIKPESLRTFPKVASSLAAPDRKWIAVQEDASVPSLTLANVESDTTRYTTLSIPAAAITVAQTEAPQTFAIDSWGGDDEYLLIKHSFDTDKAEWIVLNRNDPEKSINLTSSFAVSPTKVLFGDRNGRDLFVQTDALVRKIKLDSKTLSGPLAENVEEFTIYDNSTLLYVTKPDAAAVSQRHVGYRTDNMETPQTIYSYPASTTNLHLSFGDYFGKRYVGVTHDKTMDVFSGTLPHDTTKANLKREVQVQLTGDTQRLSMSRNGRFVVAQLPNGFVTYDIELQKHDTTVFKQAPAVERKLQWLDDYMVWSDGANTLRFYEFDGANQQDIMPVVEGQAATLSGNDKYIYGFNTAEGGLALVRAKLITN
jgi:hypothetical protein